MADAITRNQRWTAERPCPICAGHDKMPRGKGLRCNGYIGSDGTFAHCSREDMAGALPLEANGNTFAHRLAGDCRCGTRHGDAPVANFEEHRERRDRENRRILNEITYDYEGGLRVVRRELEGGDKTFVQFHRNGQGYISGRGPAPLTLYRAPELRASSKDAFVFVVEGEKCVETLRFHGLVAVTTAGGSSSWLKSAEKAAELLRGRHVVIVPDNDDKGRGYATAARETLVKVARSLRWLDLPGLEESDDVVDWMRAGNEPEDLVRLAEACPDLVAQDPSAIQWISTRSIFEPLPPTPWLSKELGVCPGRPMMLAGRGFSGKTLSGQSLLIAVASGALAWGHFPTGQPQRVRHFDFEQGRHATLKRYQRLAAGMSASLMDLEPRLEVTIFPPVPLNHPTAGDVYARESEGCSLVMVDSLAGATPGEKENESSMRGHLDMLSRVSEKTGATFVVIHHAGKPREGREGQEVDERSLVRGHSAIFDACGSVIVLVGDKPGIVRAIQVKAPAEAEGQAIKPFYLTIEDVPASAGYPEGVKVAHKAADEQKDEDKAERDGAAAKRSAALSARHEKQIPEKMEAIWNALRKVKKPETMTSRPKLLDLVIGDTTVLSKAVTRLLAEGRVVKGEEGWFVAV